MKNKLATVLATTALATSAYASDISGEKSTISNRDKAVALLESIETGNKQPVSYINSNKYIQHNLNVADGLAGFGEVLQALPKGSARVAVKRAFQDGDYVFTHTDYNFFGEKVGFDIFRFEEGKIVEHWDNLAEKTAANPSGRTQLDGPTEIQDLEKTEANKALVTEFVSQILMAGNFAQLPQFIDSSEQDYLQHNSMIADGLSGLNSALAAMAKQGITMRYSKLHKVLGEGNFVLAISEGQFADQPVAFYDLFRVDNNKLVEHWDVIEQIPAKADWKNSNGKFAFK